MRVSSLSSLLTLTLLLPCSQALAALGPNDVSVLLPLPSDPESEPVLTPSTQGHFGELLPHSALKLLPTLIRGKDGQTVLNELEVVGIRIDPCFPADDSATPACIPQIRMTWQPIVTEGGSTTTEDVGVHAFYPLGPAEFTALVGEIEGLKQKHRGPRADSENTLQIQPIIAREGLGGEYWKALRAIMLEHVGAKRLSRVTFMSLEAEPFMWDFGGFEIGPKVTSMVIPRTGTRLQSFVNVAKVADRFQGSEKPGPSSEVDTLDRVLADSSALSEADAAALRATVDTAYRIENPRFYTPNTMDCASCHAANSVRTWAMAKFPAFGLEQSQFRFVSRIGTDNSTDGARTAHTLRAFGYQGRNPLISQRTINETAGIADSIRSDDPANQCQ